MLEFYNVDVTVIIIIVISGAIIYKLLQTLDSKSNINNVYKILASILIAVLISVLYSYYNVEPDVLLETNYWE